MANRGLRQSRQQQEAPTQGFLVSCKFCSLGFVTSKKWTSVYLTISDGVVRVYDSQESCEHDPMDSALEIVLQSGFRASAIKKKDYSQNPLQIIHFFCFYIEQEQGIFAALRKLKLGCTDMKEAKQIVKAITSSASNY